MRTKAIKPPERTTIRLGKATRDKLEELADGVPGGMTAVMVSLIDKEHRRKKLRDRLEEKTEKITGEDHD